MGPTDGEVSATLQLSSFQTLIDSGSSTFKQELRSAEARQALRDFDACAYSSVTQLRAALDYSTATTICQGSCFLYAFLGTQSLLQSAWAASPCSLDAEAIRTITEFKGAKATDVCSQLA